MDFSKFIFKRLEDHLQTKGYTDIWCYGQIRKREG